MKETGSKVGCFAGFCHHPMITTNVHMHAYRYPCLKVGQKQICEQSLYDIKLICKYKA